MVIIEGMDDQIPPSVKIPPSGQFLAGKNLDVKIEAEESDDFY